MNNQYNMVSFHGKVIEKTKEGTANYIDKLSKVSKNRKVYRQNSKCD